MLLESVESLKSLRYRKKTTIQDERALITPTDIRQSNDKGVTTNDNDGWCWCWPCSFLARCCSCCCSAASANVDVAAPANVDDRIYADALTRTNADKVFSQYTLDDRKTW